MNNKKIAIVGVLAVIVTMMVGYALFSETVTINGTATAKGDFAITPTCQAGLGEEYKSALKAYLDYTGGTDVVLPNEAGYENDTCQVNGTNVSFNSNFKYPGATRYFTIILKNTGSIDATNTDTKITFKNCIDKDGDDVAETCNTGSESNEAFDDIINQLVPVGYQKADGTLVSPFDGDLSDFQDEEGNTIIHSGQSLVFAGVLQWPDNFDTEKYNGKLFTINTTAKFDFQQVTNN